MAVTVARTNSVSTRRSSVDAARPVGTFFASAGGSSSDVGHSSTLSTTLFGASSSLVAVTSPSACEQASREVWTKDLKGLLRNAGSRFADVAWTTGEEGVEGTETIWAHKAILYARAPNTFQARYLHIQSPNGQVRITHHSNSSQVSIGSLRSSRSNSLLTAPSPEPHAGARSTSPGGGGRSSRTGAAPPSSYHAPADGRASGRHSRGASGSSSASGGRSGTRNKSGPKSPPVPDSPRSSASSAFSSSASSVRSVSTASVVSDTSSIASVASTVRPPMMLTGVSQAFFEAILEYLYTAEGMVEAFEFLYEDKSNVSLASGMGDEGKEEERFWKLRQDLVFMWRSKLYADVKIVLESNSSGKRVTDPMASTDHLEDEDDEVTSFSTHKMILASRSRYFASQLLSSYADSSSTVLTLPSPPFTPASLHFTLGFLYTGTLTFSNRSFDLSTALAIYRSAVYLEVDTLKDLITSTIVTDFCHSFCCACRTCTKRVPRVLAFSTNPDVMDKTLETAARNALCVSNFGAFWTRDVGVLDYALRQSIVQTICDNMTPVSLVGAVRNLLNVAARLDTERASPWVDAIRWMCEGVESRARELLINELDAVVESPEWAKLLDGVGFSGDVLERALVLLVESLNEQTAARNYQILVGLVLLRDEGIPSLEARQLVEDARNGILRYLRRRWVGARSYSGFAGLDNWALKELSDELEIPVDDLIAHEAALPNLPNTKTGLQPAKPARAPPRAAGKGTAAAAVAARRVVDEPSASGPVNLRASVLNRNAARVSAVHGFKGTGASPQSTRRPPVTRANVANKIPGASTDDLHVDMEVANANDMSEASNRDSTASVAVAVARAGPSGTVRARAPAGSSAASKPRSSLPGGRTPSTTSVRSTASSVKTKSAVPSTTSVSSRQALSSTAASSAAKSRSTLSVRSSASTTTGEGTDENAMPRKFSPAPSAASSRSTTPMASKGPTTASNPAAATASDKSNARSSVSVHSIRSTTSTASKASTTSKVSAASKASTTTSKVSAASKVSITPKRPTPGTNTKVPAARAPYLKATPKPTPSPAASSERPKTPKTPKAPKTPKTPTSPAPIRRSPSAASIRSTASSVRRASGSAGRANSLPGSVKDKAKEPVPPLPSKSDSAATTTPKKPTAVAPDVVPVEVASGSAKDKAIEPVPPLPSTVNTAAGTTPKKPKAVAPDVVPVEVSSETAKNKANEPVTPLPSTAEAMTTPEEQATVAPDVVPMEIASGSAKDKAKEQPVTLLPSMVDTAAATTPKELVAVVTDVVPMEIDAKPSAVPEFKPEPVAKSAPSATTPSQKPVSSPPSPPLSERSAAAGAQALRGSALSVGIPCIVAPRNPSTRKQARFRAVVKYIGEINGLKGPWVGVEVPVSSADEPADFSASVSSLGRTSPSSAGDENVPPPGGLGSWNDGSYAGVRYFDLGTPEGKGSSPSSPHTAMAANAPIYAIASGDSTEPQDEERAARRRRIAGILADGQKRRVLEDIVAERPLDGSISSKRLKDASGNVSASSGMATKGGYQTPPMTKRATRGLFIRPHEVLWVVA